MKKYFRILFLSLLLFSSSAAFSLEIMNFWRHSEAAGKNSVFADIGLAPLTFEDLDFPILPMDIRVEYMPPVPLPFSVGVFFITPNPNFKSFGARLGYHFDLLDHLTDFYFVYSLDFGFLRNDILEEYNDAPVEARWYDFRLGVRRFFGPWIGIAVETGFKFESIIFLLSIKIN
jgi:hypothetical protein